MPTTRPQMQPVILSPEMAARDLYADGVVGVPEAARLLDCSELTVRRLGLSGKLAYSQDGPLCRWKIPRRGIAAYLARTAKR